MNACEELILMDVVKVDIYKKEDVTVSLPHNVAYSQSVEAQTQTPVKVVVVGGQTPVITMDLEWTSGADAILEKSPKVTSTEKKEAAGLIRTNTIEGTLIDGFTEAMRASEILAFNDSLALLTTADGLQYLCNAFAGTTEMNVKNDQENHIATIKYVAQSFSGFVSADLEQASGDDSSD